MSRSYRLVMLMACLLALQGAYAIDVHFSASDGGGGVVGIHNSYDVDDGISVSGESSASFDDGLMMTNTRSILGPGDVGVTQEYWGNDYAGMNYVYVRDPASTRMSGSTTLTPGTASAYQDMSAGSWGPIIAVSGVTRQDGKSAMQYASVGWGSLDTRQTTVVNDRVSASQDSQIWGLVPTAFGAAGYMDANVGPGRATVEGEGAAAGVVVGPFGGIDCKLSAYTGNSAGASADIREAVGTVGAGAAAGAGNINLDIDTTSGFYVGGDTEAAAIGMGAFGPNSVISGVLRADTENSAAAVGRDIKASADEGIAGVLAGAGGVGGGADLAAGTFGGGAEGAAFGAVAVGADSNVEVGRVAVGIDDDGVGVRGRNIGVSGDTGAGVLAGAGGFGGGADLAAGTFGGEAEGAALVAVAVGTDSNVDIGRVAVGVDDDGADVRGRRIGVSGDTGAGVLAGAGGFGGGADLAAGTFGGGAEGAALVAVAVGTDSNVEIGRVEAGMDDDGAGVRGRRIGVSGDTGAGVLAGAGGLGGGVDLAAGIFGGGAEAAALGAVALGTDSNVDIGRVEADVGAGGAGVFGRRIDVSGTGAAGLAAGAGNADIFGTATWPPAIIHARAEGSAVAAGGLVNAGARARRLAAWTSDGGAGTFDRGLVAWGLAHGVWRGSGVWEVP